MTAAGLAFLAADTPRSRAYAQALLARGVRLGRGLLIRSPGRPRWGQAQDVPAAAGGLGGIFVPDLSVPLGESLERLCATTATLDSGSVNEPPVVEWLRASGAALAIYSGFGGQIVRRDVLGAGPALLHAHSGWLPDYRGSTTLYYSYLREGSCAVSALLLGESIDAGPVIRRKRYPAPPPGTDVDYLYDSAIRADLLSELVAEWATHGRFLERVEEAAAPGTTYYIIHPVLKHVALHRIGVRSHIPTSRPGRVDGDVGM